MQVPEEDRSSPTMRQHYLWVIVLEVITLIGLWALGAAYR